MSDYVEAVVTLFPSDAGGRRTVVLPRDGSYRPFVRLGSAGPLLRVRFIEGPPVLAPGDSGRIVLEVESAGPFGDFVSGSELELFEAEESSVGLVMVSRLWRDALVV